VRKNAVLVIEYFIGASPEWFKEQSIERREAYFDEAEKWLKERHGKENVIAFTRQYDETSPHVCAYVVPIDPKGKLNCSHFLDGREKLSEMQTDFAEKVGKPFGLERGIEGSKAKHTTVKQYYADIQKKPQEVVITPEFLKPKEFKEGFLGKLGFATHRETPEGVAERLTQAVREVYKPAINAANRYRAEKDENEAREVLLRELRSRATEVRNLPLERVLERLECQRDTSDKNNWKTPIGRITLNGSKFFAHDIGKGGGGAIDLMMAVEELDYKGAVNRLSREFGTVAVLSECVANLKPAIEEIAKASPEPFKAPLEAPEHWSRVREYLTGVRRLSGGLVDRLHDLGKVYADKFKNCVFVLGSGQGVALRGTGEKPFHGVRGEKVSFVLAASNEESMEVAFVESPIDALSLKELGFDGRIVATVGNSTELTKAKADTYREQGLTVISAFDNDKAGDAMSRNLGQPCKRLKPDGKDWNEDLRKLRATPEELEFSRPAAKDNDLSDLSIGC
jgi:cation transport regulator ChaB